MLHRSLLEISWHQSAGLASYRAYALNNHGLGYFDNALLESVDRQPAGIYIQQFVSVKQEVRILRAPELFLPQHEGFINEHAIGRQAFDKQWQQWAMQVAANDDAIECTAGKWPAAVFHIGLKCMQAGNLLQPGHGSLIAIHGFDLPSLLRQPARVAARSAGEIEHNAAATYQRSVTDKPGGRRFVKSMHLMRKYARTMA